MHPRKRLKHEIDGLLIFWYVNFDVQRQHSNDLDICSIQELSLDNYNLLVLLRQVIFNPKLKKKSNRTGLFFEGCLR